MQPIDADMTIAKLSVLTPAEQAVLDQALTGVPAREIAEHLSLSEATVRSHLSSIYVKLGVSGRVALLAHFRGAEPMPFPQPEPAALPHPMPSRAVGWSWGGVALLEGAYALYQLTYALAYHGSQTTWLLAIGFGILCAFMVRFARAILKRPTRRLMQISLAVAAGHLAFAVRGIFLGFVPAFVVLGAIAIAIGWISFRAIGSFHEGA